MRHSKDLFKSMQQLDLGAAPCIHIPQCHCVQMRAHVSNLWLDSKGHPLGKSSEAILTAAPFLRTNLLAISLWAAFVIAAALEVGLDVW